MKILKTKFKGLLVLKGSTHHDQRGYFRELFKKYKSTEGFKH